MGKLHILVVVLTAALGSVAAHAQDRVWTSDGDRLTGKIVTIEGGALVLESAFGTVKVPLASVDSVSSDRPLKLTLADGTVVQGRLERQDAGGMLVRGATRATPLSGFSGVTALADPAIPVEPPKIWSGKGTASGLVTGGNSREKSAHADFEIVGRWEKTRLTADGGTDYGETEGRLSTRKTYGGLQGDYFVTDDAYLYARTRWEYDRFQNLDLRGTYGAGVGYQAIDEDDASLQFELGASWVKEDLRRPARDRSFATADGRMKYMRRLADGVVFTEDLRAYQSLKHTDDTRLISTMGLDVALSDTVAMTFRFIWEYDNQPSPGQNRQDTRYLAGITYRFW